MAQLGQTQFLSKTRVKLHPNPLTEVRMM